MGAGFFHGLWNILDAENFQVEGLLREYRIHLMALKAEIARRKDLH